MTAKKITLNMDIWSVIKCDYEAFNAVAKKRGRLTPCATACCFFGVRIATAWAADHS